MKSLVLRVATVALALLAIPSAANADWIAGGTVTTSQVSNSNPNAPANSDVANVTYAVYQQTTAGAFTTMLSNAGISLSAVSGGPGMSGLANDKYIFIYEVSNNAAGKVNTFFLSNPSAASDVATTTGFTFASSVTGSAGTFTPTMSSFTTPNGNMNTALGGFDADDGSTYFDSPDGSQAAMQFTIGTVTSTEYSQLIIVGSNSYNPLGLVQTADSGAADGYLPVPGPEPSTFALIGLGLPLLGWGYVRRLRANKAVLAAVAA